MEPRSEEGAGQPRPERETVERVLRESEERLRTISDNLPGGFTYQNVTQLDGKVRYTYISAGVERLFGLPAASVMADAKAFLQLVAEEERPRIAALERQALRDATPFDCEFRCRTVSGDARWVHCRSTSHRLEDGSILWNGVITDVTERKQADENLRRSEARFRLLSDTGRRLLATPDPQEIVNQLCHDVMAFLDCQVFLNYVTDGAPEPAPNGPAAGSEELRLRLNSWAGISDEEASMVEWLDYGAAVCGQAARERQCVLIEDIQHSEDKRTELIRRYGIQAYCCQPLLAHGVIIGTLAFGTATRPRFAADEVELMRAIADEVATAMGRLRTLKELEAARAEADNEKNRLAAVMETLPDGLVIVDATGGLVRANPAYDHLWGGPCPRPRSVSDYAKYPAWWADSGKPVQPEEWASARAVQHGETVVNQELQIQRADGTKAFVLNSAAPIRDAEGRITGCAVDIRDISERKQAEDLRRRLELQMQQAEKEESLGVLAGGIAHDFNNLLTVVIGNLELMLESMPGDTPALQALVKAKKAARQAADLCQQMLAYAGKTPLCFCAVQLNQLLQNMARLMTASLSAHAQLRWNLGGPLPSVHADPGLVRQIIMSLVMNASEAIGNQPGYITLTTGSAHCASTDLQSPWLQDPLPGGDYVFLEVTDTGCGIEPATLARVFEPFFTTKFTGRGLGLAAVLGIVRSHRGTIQVQSAPGRGSAFRVWLPAISGPVEAAAAAGAPAPHWRGLGTVLVVDDDEDVRSTAKELLELLGFKTLTAADGLEAVEIYRADPDRIWCVLLDATMPRLSGEATFQELVRIRGNVRVVLSSGYSKDDILARFAGHSLSGFLQKPYTLAHLVAVFQNVNEATPEASCRGGNARGRT